MDSFIKLAATTEWWISVVVVGILINFASGAIQALCPKAFSALGKKWQTRTAEKAKIRIGEIAQISASSQEIYFALLRLGALKSNALLDYLQSLVFLGFAFFSKDLFPSIHFTALFLAVLCLIQGIKDIITHGQYSLIVFEAQLLYRQRTRGANPRPTPGDAQVMGIRSQSNRD